MLDTNVVLDWLVFDDPTAAALAARIRSGDWRWVSCRRMRDELCDVLARPPFAAASEASKHALTSFDRFAFCVEVGANAAVPIGLRCADADDQIFIDVALNQRARWLFTRDKALLALAPGARRHGLEIVRPGRAAAAADHLRAP